MKLAYYCKSEWRDIPAGVPQGTKLGPWLFLLMIDDIDVADTDLWKFVDDTTMAECVERNEESKIQIAVTELTEKAHAHKFQLNEAKCKELRITFAKNDPQFDPILVNDKLLETVSTAKLLGLNISSDLKCNHHISEITRKAAPRFYFMRQLKRANIPTKELLTFYSTCIRPTLEYACPVFHNSLPKYLSDDLEQLQKRVLRIIYPFQSYSEALKASGLPRLFRPQGILDKKIVCGCRVKSKPQAAQFNARFEQLPIQSKAPTEFAFPRAKTDRFKNSFVISKCKYFCLVFIQFFDLLS